MTPINAANRRIGDGNRDRDSVPIRGVRYVPYQASQFTQLRELFKIVWGANRSEAYDAKYWNESPTGLCPAVLGLWGEQVVGVYMIWPMPFSDGREQILGGQSIDSMVHPMFQGKGLLRELAARCYEICGQSQVGVMFGTPNRANFAGTVGGQNWCHVCNVVDFVRPLPPMSFRKKRWIATETQWICESADRELSGCVSQKDCPDDVGAFVENCSPIEGGWQISRTPTWMRYRYRSVPDAEYYTIRLPGERGRRGMAICGFRQSKSEVKATLVETIAADEPSRTAAIRAAASWAQHKGARFLMAKSTMNDPNERLAWRGFAPFRRMGLVARTLSPRCYEANPYSPEAWVLFGGAFDTM